ncbi:MAG: hypothetical protein JXD23_00145 [Spirochaetales bacterium]|nr:hypothetical protein [Spirochaetales bacterium]
MVIKRWIPPSGNDFIKDPSGRFARPGGDPGSDRPCVRSDFEDGSWEKKTLPHDWAITGRFNRAGGGGMGSLPTAGVGWYRKKLDAIENKSVRDAKVGVSTAIFALDANCKRVGRVTAFEPADGPKAVKRRSRPRSYAKAFDPMTWKRPGVSDTGSFF